MSVPSISDSYPFPSSDALQRRLLMCGWSDRIRDDLIPEIAKLGGTSPTTQDLAQHIYDCVEQTNSSLSINDLQLMVGIMCEGAGLDYIAATMLHLRDLRAAPEPA